MIKAWVSGQAGTAVMSEHDDEWQVLAIDDIEPEAIALEAIPLLFADATDVIEISVADTAALIARLEHEWTRDRALQLILIVLDSESDLEIRADAAASAEELFHTDNASYQLARQQFFSRPMPVSCDLQGSLGIASDAGAQLVAALVSEIAGAQVEIGAIAEWFDGLPAESADQRHAKDDLAKTLVTMAPSLALAIDRLTVDSVILDLATHPAMRKISDHRTALQRLRRGLSASCREPVLPAVVPESHSFKVADRHASRRSSAEALDRVNREKDEIVRRIRHGQDDLAKRYTEQLVERQVSFDKSPEYAVKTLCDLARQAKHLHRPDLHIYFAGRAVDVKTDDWIARIQLARAYSEIKNYACALEQYAIAEKLTSNVTPINARGEIFRLTGDYSAAIVEFDRCLLRDPENEFAFSGKAAALKDCGRLSEALDIIDYALQMYPLRTVLLSRRAEILEAMGRYDDALKAFEDANSGVLRSLGRLNDALESYEISLSVTPGNLVTHIGKALTLLRMRRPDQALTALQVIPSSPLTRIEWLGQYIRGMAHLRINDYIAANAIFRSGAVECPFATRQLFANAMALGQIRRRDYRRAIQSIGELQGSLPDIIRLHAFGAVSDQASSEEVFRRLESIPEPGIANLRDRIADAFVFKKTGPTSEEALFEDEIDLFAEAA